MSTSGISTSLLSQIGGTSGTANQFVTDLNQVAEDVQGGNVGAAEQDYVTLSQDALGGATSSTATSSASGITADLLSGVASSAGSASTFVSDLNLLGADLQNGDLSLAQGDLLTLSATAENAGSGVAATGSAAAGVGSGADASALIRAAMEAMSAGDTGAVGSSLTELASISSGSTGANALTQESENYGGSASAATTSTGQMLSSLDTGSGSSGLSLLA